jgi:hypothetical protein
LTTQIIATATAARISAIALTRERPLRNPAASGLHDCPALREPPQHGKRPPGDDFLERRIARRLQRYAWVHKAEAYAREMNNAASDHAANIGRIVLALAGHAAGDWGDCSINDPIVSAVDRDDPARILLQALAGMSEETAAGICKQLWSRETENEIRCWVRWPRGIGKKRMLAYTIVAMSDNQRNHRVTVDVLAFQDTDGAWIAQCIQYDIVARANSLLQLEKALTRELTANLVINEKLGKHGLDGIPPSPAKFQNLFNLARAQLSFHQDDPAVLMPIEVHDIRLAEMVWVLPKKASQFFRVRDIN